MFKQNLLQISIALAKPDDDIEERISKKLRDANRTTLNQLKRKMARKERKRRLRLK